MRDDLGGDLLLLERTLFVLARASGEPAYDFAFDRFFAWARHQPPEPARVVARVGAIEDYPGFHARLAESGIRLVHDPDEYLLASELPSWYPRLADLTPRSSWFDAPPDARTIERELGWPVFLKGSRQTSRHRRSLSIVEGPEPYDRAVHEWTSDPILGWQRLVGREFVRLRPVDDPDPSRIPSSFEFRTIWWRGELVGFGRYWWQGRPYEATPSEREAAISIAREAARRLDVAFLVVDVAQDLGGRWLVIEVNDAQESGFAGISPLAVWRRILDLERARAESPRRILFAHDWDLLFFRLGPGWESEAAIDITDLPISASLRKRLRAQYLRYASLAFADVGSREVDPLDWKLLDEDAARLWEALSEELGGDYVVIYHSERLGRRFETPAHLRVALAGI